MNSDISRVKIPDFNSVEVPLPAEKDAAAKLVDQNVDRIDAIQQAIGVTANDSDASALPAAAGARSTYSKLAKVDGLIDSILTQFPLSHPVTLVFVGCKTDAETDAVTADVAQRLTERRVGKVLLVDSNPNSQTLSKELNLAKSEGIGDVICGDKPWKSLLQTGQVTGLDFLPYGSVSTAKTLRSSTQNFLTDAKTEYQFICASVGRNDSPLAKSFCTAADGIYLLVDLVQLTHLEAKTAADQFLLNNLPLVGCIALDAEQDQK